MNKNNNKIELIKPLIFTKKINDKHKIIPLNFVDNTVGPAVHYPPATKEWSNSVYSYNSNYIKNLPIANKNLDRLLRSYFNIYYSNKKHLKSTRKSKRIPMRFRRLSLNKIFLSKTELKHTNEKVIITLHVYNEEKRILIRKLKRLESILFISNSKQIKGKKTMPYLNKQSSLINKLSIVDKLSNEITSLNFIKETKKEFENISSYLTQEIIPKALNNVQLLEKANIALQDAENQVSYFEDLIVLYNNDYKSFKDKFDNHYNNYLRKYFLEKEIREMAYYLSLLRLNNYKFDNAKMLVFLKAKLYNLYGKNIEFNIINLKTLYLNSDIFTQAIAIKLKNRDNRLLRVLRRSLSIVKLPRLNEVVERQRIKVDLHNTWENKIKNININYLLDSYNYSKDIVNYALKEFYLYKPKDKTVTSNLKNDVNSNAIKNKSIDGRVDNDKNKDKTIIRNILLDSLKYKRMGGVRLEAKGRLTRRFTASRSVFKIKWKGGLKNIDSSYKGLSSVILRGHLKSNIQYSIINSKTRNGAFGLKGWISGR